MNELNIYKKFSYKKTLKTANLYFNNNYKWYNKKTVFAPQNGRYTISLNKYNVRICYWFNNTQEDKKTKEMIKNFILDILNNENTNIICSGECDLLDNISFIKKIQLKRG